MQKVSVIFKKIKSFVIENKFFFVFLVLNVLVHRKILMFDTQLAYGDFTPFPESASQSLSKFIYTWQEVGFGISRAYGLVFPLVQTSFVYVFRSGILAQKAFVLILPTLAYLCFNNFISYFFNDSKKWLRFILSFFYAFCPISLGEFMGGSLYSTMLIFAIFPILYKNSFLLLEKPTLKKILLHGLLISLYASIYVHIILIYFITLLAPFIYDLTKEKFKAIKKWFNFVFSALVALAANPIMFLSSFNVLQNKSVGEQTRSFVDYTPQFLEEIRITYESGKFFSALRLASMGAFDYKNEFLWTYPFYILIAFVLFFAFYRLIFLKTREKLLIISLINYLAITFFIFFTHKEWTFFIFRKIPVLFMFRNPSKLIYVSTFFFYIICYFAINTFLKLKIKNLWKYALLSLLLTTHLVYIWPIYLGDRGLSIARKTNYTIPKHFYTISEYIKINEQDPFNRSTWVPIGHEATFNKLTWLDRSKLDAQIGMKEFAGSAFEHDVLTTTYSAVTQYDTNTFINSLKIAQVEYLVLLKDDFYYNLINFDLEDFMYVLKEVPLIESTEKYDVYRIGASAPLIYTPNKFQSTNIMGAGDYYILSKEDTNNLLTLVPINKVMDYQIQPTKYYFFLFPEGTPKLVTNTQWQEHWEWNSPKVFPNIPDEPNRNTETIVYLDQSMEALAEISEYLVSGKSVPTAERQSLLNSYFNILGVYNNFLTSIPANRVDNNLKRYLVKMYLYVERSMNTLRDSNLVTPQIEERYLAFVDIVNNVSPDTCEYDYCFDFELTAPTEYNLEIYDINDESLNKSFFVNEKAFPIKGRTNTEKWADLGKISFQKGRYETGINLELEDKPYSYNKNTKTITIADDEEHKFINTFLYSFEDDVHATVTYTPKGDYHNGKPYLVWKGTLANTRNSNFCYKKENGKCYRLFLAKIQPTNSYIDTKIEFDKQVSLDESGKNEIIDFKVEELLYPTLLLTDEAYQQFDLTEPLKTPNVEFERINPTRYKLHLKNISEDFMLVFNQSYNTNWVLLNGSKERVAENRHFKVNYFANAWWIQTSDLENSSDTELTLVYYPQRHVYFSLASTIITLSVVAYLTSNKKLSKKVILD